VSNNPRIPLENDTSDEQTTQNPTQMPTKPSDSTPIDLDLARVIEAWAELPDHIRIAVMAIVKSHTHTIQENARA